MNHNERLDQIDDFRNSNKNKDTKKEKDDLKGMRHFDFDQAPRTVKLAHIEKVGFQTIADIDEYSLYNANTPEALQGIAIVAMKRLRTLVFHLKADKDDLKKIDKAIFKLSTALMDTSSLEEDETYDLR